MSSFFLGGLLVFFLVEICLCWLCLAFHFCRCDMLRLCIWKIMGVCPMQMQCVPNSSCCLSIKSIFVILLESFCLLSLYNFFLSFFLSTQFQFFYLENFSYPLKFPYLCLFLWNAQHFDSRSEYKHLFDSLFALFLSVIFFLLTFNFFLKHLCLPDENLNTYFIFSVCLSLSCTLFFFA